MTDEQVALVDVLLQVKSRRFNPQFTYRLPEGRAIAVGEVVQVPLGPRLHYGYVVSPVRYGPNTARLRSLERVDDVPRAFNEEGLALAQWLAERLCCTLGEAVGAIVPTQSLPQMVERLVPLDRTRAEATRAPTRLVDLLWETFIEGVSIEEVLRHPEARRAADRPGLRRALTALIEAGAVRCERRMRRATVRERRQRRLHIGEVAAPSRSVRLHELAATLRATPQGMLHADAVLAGFTPEVIRRGVTQGVVREEWVTVPVVSRSAAVAVERMMPTEEQRQALDEIERLRAGRRFAEVLLHGVTGSGKTLIYLESIERIVAEGGTAIVLVPEIALTPQTARRFEERFGTRVVVLHSALSDRERFESWRAIERGEIDVVVGARSAVFAPVPRLRMIVVDEAHETSYHQEHTPRYHAVHVARERMRRLEGLVVYGSATPTLEMYAQARLGRMTLLTLRQRATQIPLPETTIVDLAAEARAGGNGLFSGRLIRAIDLRLKRGEKSVLFVNRRGSARCMLCRACGYAPSCRRCSITLTYHRGEALLRCHLCDAQRPVATLCPKCAQPLEPFGFGTERIAHEIQELFPHAHIVRMDSDTTTHVGDHARLLREFAEQGDILVGTQMVAKGLDFPTVTLAAVVAADVGLHIAEYQAAERTFALVLQVAGRSGRSRAGEAIIQTYLPEHPAIRFAAQHDYEGFAQHELAERRLLQYPPFTRLSYLGILGRDRARVASVVEALAERMRACGVADVLGPASYPIPRVNDEWRMRIALKASRMDPVRAALREQILPWVQRESGVRIVVELDR